MEKEKLFRKTLPDLNRYALYLTKNPDDAYDLVGDTVLKAMEIFSKNKDLVLDDPRPWLAKVMKYIFLSQKRKKVPPICEFNESYMGFSYPEQGASLLAEKLWDQIQSQDPWSKKHMEMHMDGMSARQISEQTTGFRSSYPAVLKSLQRQTRNIMEMVA